MRNYILILCVAISLLYTPTNTVYNTQAHASVLNRSTERQIECLADNIYHESKGESFLGKLAVGFVTMNRTRSDSFPENVCEVVKQTEDKTCQFSWYCEKTKKKYSKKSLIDKKKDMSYIKSMIVAEYVFKNHEWLPDPTKGSLYFHSKSVKVKRPGKVKNAVIGRHIFYNIRERKI